MAKVKAEKYIRVLGIPQSGSADKAYYTLGLGIEEMSTEMNANVETTADILGNSEIKIGSYSPTSSVSPYSVDTSDDIHEFLQSIIDEQKTLDDLLVDIIDVKLYEEATTGAYPAIMQQGIVEITSYTRSASTGYTIDFNLHFKGNPVKGTFDPSTKKWTATTV